MTNPVLLVDGSNLLFRAVYGFGEQTCASGVISYLNSVIEDVNPESLVVCWDNGKSRARLNLYSEYKQGRKKAKEDLDMELVIAQQDLVKQYLASIGVQQFSVRGVEADDLLAWLSEYLVKQGKEVVITTSDADLWQLISSKVAIYDHRNNEYVLDAHLSKRFLSVGGLRGLLTAGGISEFKAVVGDSSDNIKGVKGIGEKAAKSLFEEYGGLAGMREPQAVKLLKKSKKTVKLFDLEDDLERDLLLTKLPALSAIPYWMTAQEISEFSEQLCAPFCVDLAKAALYADHIGLALQPPQKLVSLDLSGLLSLHDYEFYQDWHSLDVAVTRCNQCEARTEIDPVLGLGHSGAEIMFVASEATELCSTFSDPEVDLITELMRECGIVIDEVYITSVVRCQFNKSLASLGNASNCAHFLQSEVNLIRPKLIVTFGNLAMSMFTPYQSYVTKHCGEIGRFSSNRIAHSAIIAVNVTPGSALRSGKHKAHFEYATKRLKEFLISKEK